MFPIITTRCRVEGAQTWVSVSQRHQQAPPFLTWFSPSSLWESQLRRNSTLLTSYSLPIVKAMHSQESSHLFVSLESTTAIITITTITLLDVTPKIGEKENGKELNRARFFKDYLRRIFKWKRNFSPKLWLVFIFSSSLPISLSFSLFFIVKHWSIIFHILYSSNR